MALWRSNHLFTSSQIYRLALQLSASETLFTLSKSRISLFNSLNMLYWTSWPDNNLGAVAVQFDKMITNAEGGRLMVVYWTAL